MRLDEKFELSWKDLQNKAANQHINPPMLSRKKKAPPIIEGGKVAPELSFLTTEKFTIELWIV